jgi:hypothetical protein
LKKAISNIPSRNGKTNSFQTRTEFNIKVNAQNNGNDDDDDDDDNDDNNNNNNNN